MDPSPALSKLAILFSQNNPLILKLSCVVKRAFLTLCKSINNWILGLLLILMSIFQFYQHIRMKNM